VALKNDGLVVAWEGGNYNGQTNVPVAAHSGVTAIAAGESHTVALKNDGSVVAWGFWGQTTVPVVAQSGVIAIAAGYNHTVALKNDGSVVAWGDNRDGQTNVPAGLSGVTAIAARGNFTVALKTNGTVVAWGDSDYGQTTVPLAAQSGVTAIAAGGLHTVALKTNGMVVAWGWNGHGQTTVPLAAQSGVTAIAAGGLHTVALKNDSTVVAWGDNDYGQTTVPAGLSGVVAIAAGGSGSALGHTVVLGFIPTLPLITVQPVSQTVNVGQGANFTVEVTGFPLNYQWRKDDVDLVGATSRTYYVFPQTNQAGTYTVVVSNPAGSVTSAPPAVLTVIGDLPTITIHPVSQTVNEWQNASLTVIATGSPLYYQWRKDDVDLVGEMNPTYNLRLARTNQAGNYTVVVSNPVGSVTSTPAVLTVNPSSPGAVVAWGWWGPDSYTETDVAVAAQSGVIAIAAGAYHTVALKNNGSVLTWGPDATAANVPATAQSRVTAIAAGYGHTVALKTDGSVVAWVAWGHNNYGQTTVPAAAQSDIIAIAAGESHTVALKKNGSVLAWGDNWGGQTTVPTAAQRGITAIAAGGIHTVALKDDGSVVAWGWNGEGQTTVPIAAQSGVKAIAAGVFHTLALKSDGSVIEWGNGSGVPVAAQSGVIAIASGYYHNLALKNDGTVVAWGYNGWGQTRVPEGLGGVTAIAAGLSHSVVLLGTAPLPPFLDARPGGNELILSWSTNTAGFTLQSTPHLIPPVLWNNSTNLPAIVGGKWTVTNTFSRTVQFYRLRKL